MARSDGHAKTVLLLWISGIIIVVSLVFMVISFLMVPIDIQEYPVHYRIESGLVGFDVDGSNLAFGSLAPGLSATRTITLRHSQPYPLYVRTLISSNLVSVIDVDPDFVVPADQAVRAPVSLTLPMDALTGNYKGSVRFEIYRCGSFALWIRGKKC